jgi:hypothetical protein
MAKRYHHEIYSSHGSEDVDDSVLMIQAACYSVRSLSVCKST